MSETICIFQENACCSTLIISTATFLCVLAMCITAGYITRRIQKMKLAARLSDMIEKDKAWERKTDFEKIQQEFFLKQKELAMENEQEEKEKEKQKQNTENIIKKKENALKKRQQLILTIYTLAKDSSDFNEKKLKEIESKVDEYIETIENNIL